MIDTREIKGLMAKTGITGTMMAEKIGVTPKTFYSKMKKGIFGSDEIEVMIEVLNIKDPMSIFFIKK